MNTRKADKIFADQFPDVYVTSLIVKLRKIILTYIKAIALKMHFQSKDALALAEALIQQADMLEGMLWTHRHLINKTYY